MTQLVLLADRVSAERCFDPEHRSYSGDRRFDTCAFLDKSVRDERVVESFGPEACVGMAVDAATGVILAGETPDLDALLRTAAAEVSVDTAAWDWEAQLRKALLLTDLWVTEVWPNLPPVFASQVELHFEIDDVPHHAHLDLLLEDGSIIDLKTSEKRLPERGADTSVQLTEYAYAVREVYGHLAPMVGLDGLIYANPPADVRAWNPKATKPWYDRQRSTRTAEQLDAFRDDCRRREEVRRFQERTGIYPTPGRSSPFACGKCPAKPFCPSWAGYDLGAVETEAA